VGLTEEECREQGVEVEVGRFAYQASGKALCDGEARGMVKILAARGSGRITGATIVGEEASSLIAEIAAAMQKEMTARELGHVIHSHPTLPEMVREAAEDTEGLAVHKVGRRRERPAGATQQ
jgi:dihydrolipoamide dehydrogenase